MSPLREALCQDKNLAFLKQGRFLNAAQMAAWRLNEDFSSEGGSPGPPFFGGGRSQFFGAPGLTMENCG